MKRIRFAFAVGLGVVAGVVASIRCEASGDGLGDWNYTYRRYTWRGRRFEIHLEDRDA